MTTSIAGMSAAEAAAGAFAVLGLVAHGYLKGRFHTLPASGPAQTPAGLILAPHHSSVTPGHVISVLVNRTVAGIIFIYNYYLIKMQPILRTEGFR